MTQSDQVKVMRKGFKIIRPDMFRLQIKFKDAENDNWKTLEKDFASKAAVERRMKQLLEKKNIIED